MAERLKLIWSASALADLNRFVAFLERRGDLPTAAKISLEINANAEVLAMYPMIGGRYTVEFDQENSCSRR